VAPSPFAPFFSRRGYALLDGGLATQLESQGHDLAHPLWSARLLAEEPAAIERAHLAFLGAGADCIISSSYQATPQGLVESGCSPREARVLIERSWEIAFDACQQAAKAANGPAPIAAASIGPYGAYLADGSEYRGDYGLTVQELADFHRERFEILSSIAPLIAFETIPCLEEAQSIRLLLRGGPPVQAWVSFSCSDGSLLADGSPIEAAASVFDDVPGVVAVGVNCTAPRNVPSLVRGLRARDSRKEVIVYPNSGATYCGETKAWSDVHAQDGLAHQVTDWLTMGARVIGGCCRVTPAEVQRIATSLASAD
jgi:homocysteine S-methyltransferase